MARVLDHLRNGGRLLDTYGFDSMLKRFLRSATETDVAYLLNYHSDQIPITPETVEQILVSTPSRVVDIAEPILEFILDAGYDVNVPFRDGRYPLCYICYWKYSRAPCMFKRIFRMSTLAVQQKAAAFANNYGEASALRFLLQQDVTLNLKKATYYSVVRDRVLLQYGYKLPTVLRTASASKDFFKTPRTLKYLALGCIRSQRVAVPNLLLMRPNTLEKEVCVSRI